MNFSQAEDQFRQLQAQFEAGQLSEAELKARLQELMVQDEQGNWWVIGYESGRWYRHDGTDWVQADPPGSALRRQAPLATAAAGAQESEQRGKVSARPAVPGRPTLRKTPLIFIATALIVLSLGGYYMLRSAGAKPAATSTPTEDTVRPVAVQPSLVPTQTAEPAAQPSQTSEPPSTAEAEFRVQIAVSRAAIYQGPGLQYALADPDWYLKGEEFTVIAKDPTDTWFLSRAPNGIEGWLYFQWVASDFNVAAVPTASSIPPAPPPPARKPKQNSCPAPPGCQVWDPVACVCNG